jgi:hypothetical protein
MFTIGAYSLMVLIFHCSCVPFWSAMVCQFFLKKVQLRIKPITWGEALSLSHMMYVKWGIWRLRCTACFLTSPELKYSDFIDSIHFQEAPVLSMWSNIIRNLMQTVTNYVSVNLWKNLHLFHSKSTSLSFLIGIFFLWSITSQVFNTNWMTRIIIATLMIHEPDGFQKYLKMLH